MIYFFEKRLIKSITNAIGLLRDGGVNEVNVLTSVIISFFGYGFGRDGNFGVDEVNVLTSVIISFFGYGFGRDGNFGVDKSLSVANSAAILILARILFT